MPTLSSSIVKHSVATMREVEDALARQVLYGGDLLTNLLEISQVNEERLAQLLSQQHQLPAAPVGALPQAEPAALRLIAKDIATRHTVYPLGESDGALELCVAEPLPPDVESDLGFLLGVRLEQRIAPLARILQAVARDYGVALDQRSARIIARLEGRADPHPSEMPPAFDLSLSMVDMPRPPSVPPIAFPPATELPSLPPGALTADPVRPSAFGDRHFDIHDAETTNVPEVALKQLAADSVPPAPPLPPESVEPPTQLFGPLTTEPELPAKSSAHAPQAESNAPQAESNAPRADSAGPASERDGHQRTQPSLRVPPLSTETHHPNVSLHPSLLPPAEQAEAPAPIGASTEAEQTAEHRGGEAVQLAAAASDSARQSTAPKPASAAPPRPPSSGSRLATLGRDVERWRAAEAKPGRRRGPYTAAMAEQDLLDAESRDDVLAALFDFAAQYFEFTALFAVQGDLAEGRTASGPGASAAEMRRIGVPLDLPSVLSSAKQSAAPQLLSLATDGMDTNLAQDLQRPQAGVKFLLPISVRKHCILILYGCDGSADVSFDGVGPVLAFAPLVAQALERVILRRKLALRKEQQRELPAIPSALGKLAEARKRQRSEAHAAAPPPETRAQALVQALAAPARPSRGPSAPPSPSADATAGAEQTHAEQTHAEQDAAPAEAAPAAAAAPVEAEQTDAAPAEAAPAAAVAPAVAERTTAAAVQTASGGNRQEPAEATVSDSLAPVPAIAVSAPPGRELDSLPPVATSSAEDRVEDGWDLSEPFSEPTIPPRPASAEQGKPAGSPGKLTQDAGDRVRIVTPPPMAAVTKASDGAALGGPAPESIAPAPTINIEAGPSTQSSAQLKAVEPDTEPDSEPESEPIPLSKSKQSSPGAGRSKATAMLGSPSGDPAPEASPKPAEPAARVQKGSPPKSFTPPQGTPSSVSQAMRARRAVMAPYSQRTPELAESYHVETLGKRATATLSAGSPSEAARKPAASDSEAAAKPVQPKVDVKPKIKAKASTDDEPELRVQRPSEPPVFPLTRRSGGKMLAADPVPPEPTDSSNDGSGSGSGTDADDDGPEISVSAVDERMSYPDEEFLDEAPLAASSRRMSVAPQAPIPSRDSVEIHLPKVIVNESNTSELVRDLIAGDELAFESIVAEGKRALGALLAAFPGPVHRELKRGGGDGPLRASECGPVLKALVRIGPEATPFVAVRTQDRDPDIRSWATRLLGELPGLEAARAVGRRVVDSDPDVRRAALAAGRLLQGHREATGALRDVLRQFARDSKQNEDGAHAAIEMMADLRDAGSVPALVELLESSMPDIAKSAHWALVVLTRQDFGRDSRAWRVWWQKNLDRHRVEWLIDSLMHDVADVRRAAGDELKSLTKEYFGYYDDLPKKERAKAQARYLEWWETRGKQRFR